MSIYQTPQFQGFTKEELAQTEAHSIYASIAIVTVIATVGVILRFISRNKSKTRLGYDDYTILLALTFLYGLNVTVILDTALYGLGRHLPAVDFIQLPNFQKTGLANFILYFTTSAAIKASLLFLYYRYFGISKPFRLALYISAGIIFCWYMSVFFATIFQCIPVAAFWDRTIKNPKCMDLVAFSVGSGVTNLLTDVMILCLPMPMVWFLHTNRTQKLILTGIFLLGFFVCAGSIVRIVQLNQINGFDVTWELRNVFIWTSVEPSIGILSACLPTMRKPETPPERSLPLQIPPHPKHPPSTTKLTSLGPLFRTFLNLSSRTAITTKTGSGAKKSVITASESTQSPVLPRQDWRFRKLDEEAALEGQGFVPKSPVVGNKSWDGAGGHGMRTYEMGSLGSLEKKPLPKSPPNAKRVRRERW
ncbi:hypothetical protein OEA41_001681 [Lepraria neglecta]|uniref:Rhodopsin domain-containing protein n=1 Tax=Lepraria neglecta TaxID=209136 RepID=A0AAE0DM44_9LECA|nr:hypothetical protein OEA41_001681 [Lepraria neglecta]